jgi:hypothetical protein
VCMTCEILLLGSDQQSVENSIQFLFHIKHTGITTRFSPKYATYTRTEGLSCS